MALLDAVEREADEDGQQLVDDEAQVEQPDSMPRQLRERAPLLVEVQVEHVVHEERYFEQQLYEQRQVDGPFLPHAMVNRAVHPRRNEEHDEHAEQHVMHERSCANVVLVLRPGERRGEEVIEITNQPYEQQHQMIITAV